MSVGEVVAILLAGLAAGTINTIVGSGTLITFPTLLFFGYAPVVANISNTVGLVAGGITGIHGYRAELDGQGHALRRLAPASLLGAITGALLLLVLPPAAFEAIVPVLIALALVLVLAGPWLQAKAAARHTSTGRRGPGAHALLIGGVYVAGVYGGYFGAAQGVLLVGIMSVLMIEPLQRINGFKNVLGTIVNAVAAITFILVARDQVDWAVAGLIALGSLGGGWVGAHLGRRLPPPALRAVIVVIGVVAIAKMVFFS